MFMFKVTVSSNFLDLEFDGPLYNHSIPVDAKIMVSTKLPNHRGTICC